MSDVLTPTLQVIPQALYRLRWRFEFGGGKAARTGVWDNATGLESDQAWRVDKTGLQRALIQAEDCHLNFGEVHVLVDCPGHVFASMQWEAFSRVAPFGDAGPTMLHASLAGLSILTADEKITAWRDGRVTRAPLSDYDKTWNIREHTLGGA